MWGVHRMCAGVCAWCVGCVCTCVGHPHTGKGQPCAGARVSSAEAPQPPTPAGRCRLPARALPQLFAPAPAPAPPRRSPASGSGWGCPPGCGPRGLPDQAGVGEEGALWPAPETVRTVQAAPAGWSPRLRPACGGEAGRGGRGPLLPLRSLTSATLSGRHRAAIRRRLSRGRSVPALALPRTQRCAGREEESPLGRRKCED